MGSCFSQTTILDYVNKEVECINDKVNAVVDNVVSENQALKRQVVELTLRIENYGLIMSGCPCRVSPSSYEISKRLGCSTV